MRGLNHGIKLMLGLCVLLGCRGTAAEKTEVEWSYRDETVEQRNARMSWWREARFGMFIHWGVYSVPAGTYKGEQIGFIGEWIMHRAQIPIAEYKEYARQFNPVKYDPDAWVRMARDAGMKYLHCSIPKRATGTWCRPPRTERICSSRWPRRAAGTG
jgi:alpha-L-fucosidase